MEARSTPLPTHREDKTVPLARPTQSSVFPLLTICDTVNIFVHVTRAAHQEAVDTERSKRRPQQRQEAKEKNNETKGKFTKVCHVEKQILNIQKGARAEREEGTKSTISIHSQGWASLLLKKTHDNGLIPH